MADILKKIRIWGAKRKHLRLTRLLITSPPHPLILLILLTACHTPPTPTPSLPAPEMALATAVATSPPTDAAATAYPLPTAAPVTEPYLAPTRRPATATAVPAATSSGTETAQTYLPAIASQPLATDTPAPSPPTATPTPTPIATLDFTAVRRQLNAQGLELAPVKIGFHVGIGGNSEGLEAWMRRLDEAGVPFFLKSVDNAQPILFAQELKKQSGVPHILVYRKAAGGEYDWDVPDYSLPPDRAAALHWQNHREAFPPELDPSQVWLETINEVDKNEAEWLGQFALKTAELALADGFNWAAFGWASGEPEPEHWQTPSMLQFLRLAGANPDRLAIALHEYSYLTDDIGDAYPYKVGRFQELLQLADRQNIPRPTILITEWGWTYEHVPPPEDAMADIMWASQLYAPYPEVKGAAIWYLGGGFTNIADEAQLLIYPVMVYALQNYFSRPLPPERAPIQPELFAP